jgi:hypothetical protein
MTSLKKDKEVKRKAIQMEDLPPLAIPSYFSSSCLFSKSQDQG